MPDYTELHVYDFDDTLYKTPLYDYDGVQTPYIQLVVQTIKAFIKNRIPDLDPNMLTANEDPSLDLDKNHVYEILYNNEEISEETFNLFNRKIRDKLKKGSQLQGNTRNNSYYITPERDWYNKPEFSLPPDSTRLIRSTETSVRKSIASPNVYTIIMTGRTGAIQGMKQNIEKVLSDAGITPDELLLRPQYEKTATFKNGTIERILQQFPEIRTVHIWEDRSSQAFAFQNHFRDSEIDLEIHIVEKHYLQELKKFIKTLIKQSTK